MELVKQDASFELAPLLGGNITGFEDVDQSCVSRPYMAIAQNTSKMAMKGSQTYIDGLIPGMFYSPTTRQTFGDTIDVCIVKFTPQYAIYSGRDQNQMGMPIGFKGYVPHNGLNGFVKGNDNDLINPQTKEIAIDKRNFIIMFPDHVDWGMFMLSMSSSGIPISRRLITQAMSIRVQRGTEIVQAPIWSSVWRLKTGLVQSKRGVYYQIATVERVGWCPKQAAPVIKGAFEELANIDTSTYYEEEPVIVEHEVAQPVQQPVQQTVQQTVQRVFSQSAPKPDVSLDDVPLF